MQKWINMDLKGIIKIIFLSKSLDQAANRTSIFLNGRLILVNVFPFM